MARNSGRSIIDFGAHPGAPYASLTVSAPDIDSNDNPNARIVRRASVDHSEDEHSLTDCNVTCGDIQDGVSFTIHVYPRNGNAHGAYNVAWEY